MILETILFSLFGLVLGVILGLLPGLHSNNVLPLLLTIGLLFPSPYYLAVLIVSIAIAQVFTSFIPSIFLGAPEADTSLSVLPGHRLLFEGNGYEAVKLTVIGGVGALITSLIIVSLFANYFVMLYDISRPYVQYLIAGVILFMIISEKKMKSILSALLVFSLSGLFGILVLNSSLVSQQNALFPTLSGLFGISSLIVSISQKSKIPDQKEDSKLNISKINLIKSIVLGAVAGVIVGFLPALGVSQAATMVQYLGGMGEARAFLVSLSGINVANEVFSLNSLYLVNNPRSGSSVAIAKILGNLTFNDILLFIGVILFISGISAALTLYLGKKIPKFLAKLDYKKISLTITVFMFVMIFLLTGVYGLLITFTATAIGLLCAYLEVRRSHCMGVLLLPTFLFFAGLNPLVISFLRI
jgi:putative membrane protein